MKIVAALFGQEISPRFDCCVGLLVCDEESERQLDLRGWTVGERLEEVIKIMPDCLLCGGIRRCDLYVLNECGINVWDGLTGEARRAVEECQRGTLGRAVTTNNSPRLSSARSRRCRRKKGGNNARS